MYVVVVYVRGITVKKSCKNGECGVFEHLLFLLRSTAYSSSTLVSVSVFIASAGILSGPADLPFFNCLMAWYIYLLVGGSQSTGRLSLAGGISGRSCGAGLFSKSSKRSIHFFFWPSSSGIGFPPLSFPGLSGFPNFPESFLMVEYSSCRFLW